MLSQSMRLGVQMKAGRMSGGDRCGGGDGGGGDGGGDGGEMSDLRSTSMI